MKKAAITLINLLSVIILLIIVQFTTYAQSSDDSRLLMHNPNGLRIEHNITTGELEVWISPKADESIEHFDRNFSNRDDHTSVFDKISFPKLKGKSFQRCDYDPFYSKVIFSNQVMHLATLYDYPAILIWFDKPEAVDFKTDKEDGVVERTKQSFICSHPDRGYDFTFAAGIGQGAGTFIHQLQIQKGRSTYARVDLAEKQLLVVSAGIGQEEITAIQEKLAASPAKQLIAESEKTVQEKTQYGRVIVNDDPQLQKLMDMNKRIWVSMQDKQGAIRASIKKIYYLIWVRDGGMAASFTSQTGWNEPVDLWANYLLKNPTVIKDEEPAGRFFGQLVGGPINKWEEDGLFYATLSAFTHWTQTGDKKYISGEYLQTLKDANSWLEEYCFDDEMGLFGRYHYCETPLVNSRGHNWDNAVGKYTDQWQPRKYKGHDIVRSYDIYINMLAYSTYRMLAAMENGDERAMFMEKAQGLEKNMKQFFPEEGMPYYGKLITASGETILAEGYGLDETDYQWSLSLSPFYPQYFDAAAIGNNLLDTLRFEEEWFLAAFFSVHGSLDNLYFDQHRLMQTMNYMTKQSAQAGKILPMAYAMLEKSGVDVDNPRVIRPQPFTMGPWFSSLTNMALRRLPFGMTVRNTVYIDGIENYQYKGSLVNYAYQGQGEITGIKVNGKLFKNTWQVPENALNEAETELVVMRDEEAEEVPCLVTSNVLLEAVNREGSTITYHVKGFGKNFLAFNNLPDNIHVANKNGKKVNITKDKHLGADRINFQGFEDYVITIEQ